MAEVINMVNEETTIAPEPEMTIEDVFKLSQESFNVDAVRRYAEDSPMREIFERVEEIKAAMQRKADVGMSEITFPFTYNFVGTGEYVADFFESKGFDVDAEIAVIEEVMSCEVTIRW